MVEAWVSALVGDVLRNTPTFWVPPFCLVAYDPVAMQWCVGYNPDRSVFRFSSRHLSGEEYQRMFRDKQFAASVFEELKKQFHENPDQFKRR